ncbi:hypothetical protein L0156_10355 [bacterium]|nr:hypothetical protein [bacterium]
MYPLRRAKVGRDEVCIAIQVAWEDLLTFKGFTLDSEISQKKISSPTLKNKETRETLFRYLLRVALAHFGYRDHESYDWYSAAGLKSNQWRKWFNRNIATSIYPPANPNDPEIFCVVVNYWNPSIRDKKERVFSAWLPVHGISRANWNLLWEDYKTITKLGAEIQCFTLNDYLFSRAQRKSILEWRFVSSPHSLSNINIENPPAASRMIAEALRVADESSVLRRRIVAIGDYVDELDVIVRSLKDEILNRIALFSHRIVDEPHHWFIKALLEKLRCDVSQMDKVTPQMSGDVACMTADYLVRLFLYLNVQTLMLRKPGKLPGYLGLLAVAFMARSLLEYYGPFVLKSKENWFWYSIPVHIPIRISPSGYTEDAQETSILSIAVANRLSKEWQRRWRNIGYQIVLPAMMMDFQLEEKLRSLAIESYARKAAVAAVMSRNMSHNIGSHVLARLSSAESLEAAMKETIATFNSYLRTRMDFLADISTAVPVVTVPKRLYSDVCAYLKPSNPNDQSAFNWQELLMERISGTDLNADGIEIKVSTDKVFACPNDTLGAHALYVILENFIRNCAKHAGARRIDIRIDVVETNTEFWQIQVYDSENKCDSNLVDRLNREIRRPILEEGRLRRGAWGVLEMKIAAAYLRKLDPDLIDEEHKPPLLTARINHDNNLGYEFFLLKPKFALVIHPDSMNLTLNNLKEWGIETLPAKKVKSERDPRDHEFAVLIGDSAQANRANHLNGGVLRKSIFSRRCLALHKAEVDQWPRMSIISIQNNLWEKWAAEFCNARPSIIRCSGGCMFDSIGSASVTSLPVNGSPIFLFDNHGEYLARKNCKSCDTHHEYVENCRNCVRVLEEDLTEAMAEAYVNKFAYYEPYSSNSPIGFLMNNLPEGSEQKQRLMWELTETGATIVAVIDERIQAESEKVHDKNLQKIPVCKILEWMKVFLFPSAGSGFNLNKLRYDDGDKKAMETWLFLRKNVHFLVIHLGVIEKLLRTTSIADIDSFLRKHEEENPQRSVIVISGRGRPSNLPDRALFLHYSPVARYLMEERSKYHLTKLLFSAREIKNE